MVEEPDRIRNEIEETRAELSRNVDRLADKTSPKRMAQRRWTAVKERVMGVSSSAQETAGYRFDETRDRAGAAVDTVQEKATQTGQRIGDAAGSVADSVRQAPAAVARQTQGNPLAVGLIAFGAGLLTASLIPDTAMERRAGREIKERAGDVLEPVREPLMESAQQLKSDLGDAARDAADEVKQTAKDAAGTTREQARDSAQDAKEQTRAAATRNARAG
jgi:ElaB/YqjD/DUF883 family membrane-anchored ribosome-binding protein